jgi:hypothetical protein
VAAVYCVLKATVYNVMDMKPLDVHAHGLRRLKTDSWTAVLAQEEELGDVTVVAVAAEPLPGQRHTRYLVTLDGQPEAAPLWGTETTAGEAAFYREIGPSIPRLLPHCWWQQESEAGGWLLLDEVPTCCPPEQWATDDVEKVIAMLASLHATFWKQRERLDAYAWLPQPWQPHQNAPAPGYLEAWRFWDGMTGGGRALSYQAVRNAGGMAPLLIRAVAGLEILRRLRGWPGVIERQHLEALTALLDDPLPLLHPLRELPLTLVHGNPAPRHWRLTLLGERRLTDWRGVAAGPGISDLVRFTEAAAAYDWPVDAQTMIDSYLLRLHVGLPGFDSRAARQALPAALCLYVITAWLPRFAEWFQPFVHSPRTWASLLAAGPDELIARDCAHMVAYRGYLADLFVRFWHASNML